MTTTCPTGAVMTVSRETSTELVLAEVGDEVLRAYDMWGEQNWPDVHHSDYRKTFAEMAQHWQSINPTRLETGTVTWDGILLEEVFEALAEDDAAKIRAELVQVAAVAVNWIEAIDRRSVSRETSTGRWTPDPLPGGRR